MSTLLVIQLADEAPPGRLADWAQARGLELRVVRIDRGEVPPGPGFADAVVVLGSDHSVARPTADWDPPLRTWVRRAIDAGTPVLGTCFGAQLLAAVLGGRVRLADGARSELGWFELDDPADGIPGGPWLGWHEDVIEAPPGAQVAARNGFGLQAFREGPHLGVQFHPEVTPEIADGWASLTDGRRLARESVDLEALAAHSRALEPAAQAAAYELFDGWAQRAGLLTVTPANEEAAA